MSGMDITKHQNAACRTIGLLPLPGFAMMSYASLTEPMRAANLLAGKTLYNLVNFSTDLHSVSSSGSGGVAPQAIVGQEMKLDALFVIAGGDPVQFNDRSVFAWLKRVARQGALLGGVSGGPVVLAKAGLMTGRRMTVHWEHAPALAEISPHLVIERTLYVIDRDRVTCAGGTAPMDLMHALISAQHGAAFARQVSDWFMHTEVRPSAGSQRSALVNRVGSTQPAVLDAVKTMEAHVAEPLTLVQIAENAGISARQLNRLFQADLSVTVMQYYRDLRLEKANNLLRNAPMSLTEIALATGFANSSHFSRVYADKYNIPPSLHRLQKA